MFTTEGLGRGLVASGYGLCLPAAGSVERRLDRRTGAEVFSSGVRQERSRF